MLEIRFELITKIASIFRSTYWASRASIYIYIYIYIYNQMEKSGLDPKLTIRKIAVLPIKLYPLIKILNTLNTFLITNN